MYRRYGYDMSEAMSNWILERYENDNRELHERFFASLNYDEIFSRRRNEPYAEGVGDDLDGIKDALAICMDLVLRLLKQSKARSDLGRSRTPFVRRLRNRVARFFKVR